jgi:hypothetical protein
MTPVKADIREEIACPLDRRMYRKPGLPITAGAQRPYIVKLAVKDYSPEFLGL